jgi:hypothetical protein
MVNNLSFTLLFCQQLIKGLENVSTHLEPFSMSLFWKKMVFFWQIAKWNSETFKLATEVIFEKDVDSQTSSDVNCHMNHNVLNDDSSSLLVSTVT